MTPRRRAALAIASGGVLAFGAYPFRAWPVVFVSLALLALAWDGARPRIAMLCGWLAGTTATLGAFYWIVGTVTRFTNLPLVAAVIAYVLMACAAGLTLAAAGLLVGFAARVVPHAVACALAIVVVERYAPSVFPWQIASPLIYAPWIPQSADLLGVTGLGAVLVAIASVSVRPLAIRWHASHEAGPAPRAMKTSAWIAAGIAFVALWTYGAIRTAQIRDATARAPIVRVALVQPVIPPTVRWEAESFGPIVDMLRAQTRAAMSEHVDLVVWSEGAFPYALTTHATRDGAEAPAIMNTRVTAPILVGALAVDSEEHRFNAAFVREPDGSVSEPVAKRVLVPFGEYVPLLGAIPWVRRTFHRVLGLSAGERPEVLRTHAGLELGVLNCFEDTLGYVAADARNVDLLVNITNDAWFGRGAAPWQHLMLAQWRAIELRREMVRAVNTGVTGRVDALGHLVESAPLWERATFISDARKLSMHTAAPFVIRFAPPFAAAVLATAIVESIRRARRKNA